MSRTCFHKSFEYYEIIMTEIRFFTPVEYGNHTTSFTEKLIEKADFYFYLGGRKVAEIIPGNMEKNSQAVILKDERVVLWKTALKVASYFTIILPALMFLIKTVLRNRYSFHTYPHERKRAKGCPKKDYLIKKIKDIRLRILYLKPLRKNLKHLEVHDMSRALECMKLFPNLKTFKIDDKQITDEELIELAANDFPNLENLTIKSWGLPWDEEEEEWEVTPEFFVSCCEEGIKALAASNKFSNLNELNLEGILFRLKALAESKNFSKLNPSALEMEMFMEKTKMAA